MKRIWLIMYLQRRERKREKREKRKMRRKEEREWKKKKEKKNFSPPARPPTFTGGIVLFSIYNSEIIIFPYVLAA